MIFRLARFKVLCNSNAKIVYLIDPRSTSNFKFGRIVKLVVKQEDPKVKTNKSKINKSDRVWGLIVRTKIPIRRDNGTLICFNENAVILVQSNKPIKGEYKLLGTRVNATLPSEVTKFFPEIEKLGAELI